MRALAVALPAMLVCATGASAIERHDTMTMTCAALSRSMAADGSAILRYPSSKVKGMMRFDLYVSRPLFCPPWNGAGGARARTIDNKSCRVMRCFEKSRTMARF